MAKLRAYKIQNNLKDDVTYITYKQTKVIQRHETTTSFLAQMPA